eukprot:UN28817
MQIPVINLNHIKLEGDIGCGGFASVMRGKYGQFDIALKRLEFPDLSTDSILSYCKEAFISFSLHHRNVVRFYGVTLKAPHLYLVYELCNKGSLLNLLKNNKQLTLTEKFTLALHAAKGLRFLHGYQIIHRDVNTNNLLVNQDEDTKRYIVKVCDFGTARKLEYASELEYVTLDALHRERKSTTR